MAKQVDRCFEKWVPEQRIALYSNKQGDAQTRKSIKSNDGFP
jgi:hypothetical protein